MMLLCAGAHGLNGGPLLVRTTPQSTATALSMKLASDSKPRSTPERVRSQLEKVLVPKLLQAEMHKMLQQNLPSEVAQQPRPSQSPRAEPKGEEELDLWSWRLALLLVTASWGANFPTTKLAIDQLGGGADMASLFIAGRFLLSAVILAPAAASASSAGAVRAGAAVGGLCAFGYVAQAAALALGSQPATCAFICSLQAVVVALITASRGGGLALKTGVAVALAVAGAPQPALPAPEASRHSTAPSLQLPPLIASGSAWPPCAAGIGFLELPEVLAGGLDALCLGDVVALGQPLGFGASYIVLDQAMKEHPEDEMPLAALQCALCAVATLAIAAASGGVMPWELNLGALLPSLPSLDGAAGGDYHLALGGAGLGAVPSAVLYTGLWGTAATIWLQAAIFKRLPAVDASVILSTEPLWAAGFAALLLGDVVGANDVVGGLLIIAALAVNEELVPLPASEAETQRPV
jgi:drug/metabolite transporter (DMT)-like permease